MLVWRLLSFYKCETLIQLEIKTLFHTWMYLCKEDIAGLPYCWFLNLSSMAVQKKLTVRSYVDKIQ